MNPILLSLTGLALGAAILAYTLYDVMREKAPEPDKPAAPTLSTAEQRRIVTQVAAVVQYRQAERTYAAVMGYSPLDGPLPPPPAAQPAPPPEPVAVPEPPRESANGAHPYKHDRRINL